MTEYEVGKGKSRNCYVAKTVLNRSLQRFAAILPARAVVNTKKNTIKETLDCSEKIFDALKSCVCVAKHTALTTLGATSVNSAAGE